MDMSAAFAAAVKLTLLSAVIVYDCFHVSKLLNTAVDQVRRAKHRGLSARRDSTLKNTRCHWLTGPENLEPQKPEELKALFARNAVVVCAWTDRRRTSRFLGVPDRGGGRDLFQGVRKESEPPQGP